MVNHGIQLDIVVIFFTILAIIAVTARFWVRIRILKRFEIEDWLLALTLVWISRTPQKPKKNSIPNSNDKQLLFCGLAVTLIETVRWGVGKHIWELTGPQMVVTMHVSFPIYMPLRINTNCHGTSSSGTFRHPSTSSVPVCSNYLSQSSLCALHSRSGLSGLSVSSPLSSFSARWCYSFLWCLNAALSPTAGCDLTLGAGALALTRPSSRKLFTHSLRWVWSQTGR